MATMLAFLELAFYEGGTDHKHSKLAEYLVY